MSIAAATLSSIAILYGSNNGNTEHVCKKLKSKLEAEGYSVTLFDAANGDPVDDISNHAIVIFALPTWYYGEHQEDIGEIFEDLASHDWSGNFLAFVGLGDQRDYADYFCDSPGVLYQAIKETMGSDPLLVGTTPTAGYTFTASKALIEVDGESRFVGLCIDEDRQADLTEGRLTDWVAQIDSELCALVEA